jgi:hypothetical protein
MHTPAQIQGLLHGAGLHEVESKCVGFGPFSLFGRVIVPERAGIAIHMCMQALADRRIPPFHTTGSHYLALAEK